jgi:cytochrome c biogenesis protein CcmG/thiol:disulfide interchange protein DsbE
VNWKVLGVGLVVVVPLVAVLAAGFGYDPRAIDSPLVGKQAPDFTLSPVDGSAPIKLSSLRDEPVVLNFWATWCEPCKAEHPILLEAARQLGDRVHFVSVVYQDEPAKIQKWLAAHGSAYPTLVDQGSQAAIAFGVYGVPETYVIDQQGRITYKFVGPIDPDTLVEELRPLLGGS